MLAVAIHDDDGVAAGVLESGAKRKLFAEVPAQSKGAELGKVGRFFGKNVPGIVRRTVIDDDQFVSTISLAELGSYAGEECAQVSRFFIKRNYK